MRAMIYTGYGPPDVLHLTEVEKPVPGDDDVLVRVQATQVTAADIRARGSNFPGLFWIPARVIFGVRGPKKTILGTNFAGEVEAVGRNVTRFKAGDAVFGSTGGEFGAYAEYLCLPEDAGMVAKPENISYEEAAAIPFGAQTALFFLRDKGNIQSGQHVLIYGASGAVGTAAVQLAKHFGAEVTGVCSTRNLDLVTSLGADRVIDYTQEDFTRGDQTYDLIFETVGKSSVSGGMSVLKDGGIYLANLIGPAVLVRMLSNSIVGSKKMVSGIASDDRESLEFLSTLVEAGDLKPVIDRTYPFEQIADAHRYADTGRKRGNVVITLDHDN
ncbi:NAD(P)-dependent alcohol dehydrogenase [soil metagenome]